MLRKEVVAIAEKDPEYGRCGTCKHYQHLMTCGNCSRGSKYCFDWKEYEKKLLEEKENQKKDSENAKKDLYSEILELLYDNNVQADQKLEGLADDIVSIFRNRMSTGKEKIEKFSKKYQAMSQDESLEIGRRDAALEVAVSYTHAYHMMTEDLF